MTNDDKPFNLIDGANGEAIAVAREVEAAAQDFS